MPAFVARLTLPFVFAAVFLAATLPSEAQPAPEAGSLPSLEVILANHVQARGGAERLRAVSAIRMTGTMTGPSGEEVPTVISMKRPDRIRQEIEVEGETLVQAFDGTRGWTLNPMMAERPVEVPRAVAQRMASQADFDGPLVDAAAKGHRVELAGEDRVGERSAVKLKLTKKSGEVQFVWLDRERWLEVKSEGTVDQGGRSIRVESRNSDFRSVDGITSPFVVEVFADGRLQQRIVLEQIEFPANLDDRLFQPPSR